MSCIVSNNIAVVIIDCASDQQASQVEKLKLTTYNRCFQSLRRYHFRSSHYPLSQHSGFIQPDHLLLIYLFCLCVFILCLFHCYHTYLPHRLNCVALRHLASIVLCLPVIWKTFHYSMPRRRTLLSNFEIIMSASSIQPIHSCVQFTSTQRTIYVSYHHHSRYFRQSILVACFNEDNWCLLIPSRPYSTEATGITLSVCINLNKREKREKHKKKTPSHPVTGKDTAGSYRQWQKNW